MDALHPETRYAELPPVQVIDLRQELRAGNRSMFSRALQEAMDRVLAAGQQTILFLNRRGTATFIICRDCGHVLACEHCDVPLTYHEARGERQRADEQSSGKAGGEWRDRVPPLRAAGGAAGAVSASAPAGASATWAQARRRSPSRSALWPQARVVRWDRDVTGHKGSHDADPRPVRQPPRPTSWSARR